MPRDSYTGIQEEATAQIKRSGSRFFAYLYPVRDTENAKARLNALREKYPDATHICHATVLGIQRDYQHCSDDGEPSNSAGRPILHALLSSGVSYVFAAVVRYYGGKKLGVPGLIEAYGTACAEAIDQAGLVTLQLMDRIECSIEPMHSYLLYNALNKDKRLSYDTDECNFSILCPQSMTSQLRKELSELPTLALLK